MTAGVGVVGVHCGRACAAVAGGWQQDVTAGGYPPLASCSNWRQYVTQGAHCHLCQSVSTAAQPRQPLRRDADFDALLAGSDDEEGGQPSQSLGGRGGGGGADSDGGSGSDGDSEDGSGSDSESDAESEGGFESAHEDLDGGASGEAVVPGWGNPCCWAALPSTHAPAPLLLPLACAGQS